MRIHTHNSIGKRLFGRGPLAGAVIFHSPLPIYSLPALSPPSPLFFHLRAYVCVVCVCGRVCVCVGVFNNSCKVRKGKRYTRSRHCWWGSPSFLSFSFHLTIFSSPSSSAFVIPFQKLFPTLRNLLVFLRRREPVDLEVLAGEQVTLSRSALSPSIRIDSVYHLLATGTSFLFYFLFFGFSILAKPVGIQTFITSRSPIIVVIGGSC